MNFNIKDRRKELGLTLEELADRVGVSVATVSRWERGDIKSFKTSNIEPLARALEVPAFQIYSGSELEKQFYKSTIIESNTERQLIRAYRDLKNNIGTVYGLKNGDVSFLLYSYPSDSDFENDHNYFAKLLNMWIISSEKDKKTAAFALGFDYEPKEDPPDQK